MRVGRPTYDLAVIQQLVGQGPLSRIITSAAKEGAAVLLFELEHIVEAVLTLTPTDFYKSMESEKCPGRWQDVYRLRYRGIELYIKVQLSPDGRAVVVQFKRR
jgi:motility quorum-sensing regulator/GCU-specific mRNA interferase toxin